MSPGGGNQKASGPARIGGSIIAGLAEISLFHPVDTVAKRLMSNTQGIAAAGGVNKIVFKQYADAGAVQKWKSLFPGIGWGASYKVLQRTYKWGGQLYVKDFLIQHHGESFEKKMGKKNGRAMLSALAGSLIGMGEVALLPLDVLKIKAQTNPEALAGRGVVDIFRSEGMGLYRGAGWTMARNAPGSFALFGGAAVANNFMGLEDGTTPSWGQSFVSSIAGSTASIAVAAPLDVVKTRIQNRAFDDPRSGVSIIKDLLAKEGPSAFFKGLTPKLFVVGPKLIFSFTIAQRTIGLLDEYMKK